MRPHASLSDIVALRSSKIETAKGHLAQCMEREDWPSHNCAATCDDLAYLLAEREALRAEVESLQDAHAIMKNVADGRQAEIEQLRAQVERLRHLIGVVLYREADPIAAAELIERARERSRAGQT